MLGLINVQYHPRIVYFFFRLFQLNHYCVDNRGVLHVVEIDERNILGEYVDNIFTVVPENEFFGIAFLSACAEPFCDKCGLRCRDVLGGFSAMGLTAT